MDDFGTFMKEAFRAGRTLVISDSQTDERISESERLAYMQRGIRAFAGFPLLREGRFVMAIALYEDRPRAWADEELVLAEATAEVTWAAVERAYAQEALRISEGRFRTVTDAVPQIIWANDANGKANYFNRRWFEYSGLTFEQSVDIGWEAIVHPDDAAVSMERWMKAQSDRTTFDTEYRLRRADGTYRWHIGRNIPLKDDDGSALGWIGSATDIENVKNVEDALRHTADRLQLALNAGKLGSYEYDFKTQQMAVTTQHKANFGYGEDEAFSSENLDELILPEDRSYREDALRKARQERTIYEVEYRIRLRTGDIRWIKSMGRMIYDDNGELQKMVGITLDTTEQKLFTAELSKQVAERTLELQRSNEDLRQFAHVASHDLKEPVRKIQTFNNRILDEYGDQLSSKVKTYLEKIGNATDRMFSMIEGVLRYSKLGKFEHAFEQVNLNETISRIRTDLELMIHQKSGVLTWERLPTITAIDILMYQLFYNLILNSLKFSKLGEPSVIHITSKTTERNGNQYAEITLADNGIGFDEVYDQAIFETFTRLNSADEYEGTGLGLALCKKIVERHHGFISASGKPQKGAIFTILLPT
jgi:PAS domain S-box-containing protein